MEEHFKNKLKNHKVDWDKEELLSGLQEELSPDKSRFDWKWFLLFPFLLFATCWGWNNVQMVAENAALTQVESNSTQSEQKDTLVKNNPINQNEINVENNYLSSKTSKQSNEAEAKLTPSESKIKQEINTNRPQTNTKSNAKLPVSKSVDSSKMSTSASRELSIENSDTTEAKPSELSKSLIDIQVSKASTNDVDFDEIRKDIVLLKPIASLSLKEIDEIDEIDEIGVQQNLPTRSITEVSQKKANLRKSLYISGAGEIGLVLRNRTFNSENTEFVQRLENNEETEKPLFAIATNLHIGYQHTSGWSLQSGLEYMEIREVFDYNKVTSETISVTEEKILYFIVDNMDTTFVVGQDTTNVFRTVDRTVKHFNKQTFYSIPLEVGYQFDLKKAKLTTRLGLSYTFSHNYKGRTNIIYENGGNEISDINPEFRFELKNRVGLQAGLALEYPFLKQSQVFVTATYRSSPNLTLGMTEQRYHSLLFGAGFRFSLGKR